MSYPENGIVPEEEMKRNYYGFIHAEDYPFVKYAADALFEGGVTNVQVKAAEKQIKNNKNLITTQITGRHADIQPGTALIYNATTLILQMYTLLIERGYSPDSAIMKQSVDAKLNGIIQRERENRNQRRSA